jgi:hypothetical protein
MKLSQSYDPGCKFDLLTRVIFLSPFLIDFFLISSFNIGLIEN